MRPTAALAEAARRLAAGGVPSARAEAEMLLMHLLGTDRAGLYARTDGLDAGDRERLARLVARRTEGVPLQHLTGEQPFGELTLRVRPGVFVPRPETEVVLERALEAVEPVPSPVAVDVGSGAGAIALSIKHARPDARVVATDTSEEAIALARENAERLGLTVEVLLGDLLAPLPPGLLGRLDLVVSNPPYVRPEEHPTLPEEVRRDPREALVGGTQVHRRLAEEAPRWLRPGGWLVVEIGADQGGEVRSLLAPTFDRLEILPDLAGRDRVARGRFPGRA